MARLTRQSAREQRPPLVALARQTRRALMAGTALRAAASLILVQPVMAQPAPNAQPVFQNLAGGSATVSQTPSSTTIVQTSGRAALNWQSFNVGSQQTVTFQQPSASSVALNTVTGPNPSQIAGKIDANGQIVLVNQSGVIFYRGSQVNAAGLAVSAAGANTATFMAGGKIVLDQAGAPDAKIVNRGQITIQGAGLASLVAPRVANAGTIDAKLGHVVLAGAKTATLDLYGDKLVSVAVTGAVTQAPDGTDALVTNSGTIRADGGTVRLTARAVDGVVTRLVTAGGSIQANSVGNRTGRIAIDGIGGSIVIDGAVSAAGQDPATQGGRIQMLASGRVALTSGATISASGAAGGGTIAVGTTLKRAAGGAAVTGARTARSVTVAPGATLTADAGTIGNGGTIAILSTGTTAMGGLARAQGGQTGGNGGAIQIGGPTLSLTGLAGAGATLGKIGSLLLSTSDLYISDISPATAVAVTGVGLTATAPAVGASWIAPSLLMARDADVTLTANNLYIATSLGTANTLAIGPHNLTLIAGANLTVDRGFAIAANNIVLTAGGSIALNAQAGVTAGLIAPAQIATLGAASLTGQSATLAAGTGISLSSAAIGSATAPLATLDLSVTGSGGISQKSSGILAAQTLTSAGGVQGPLLLTGTANAIGTIAGVTAAALTVVDTQPLTLAGIVSAGTADLTAPSIGQTAAGTVSVDVLTSTGGVPGSLTLDGIGNRIGTIAAVSAGTLTVASGTGLVLAGAVTTGTADLSAPSLYQGAADTLTAKVLTSQGGFAGDVALHGTANAIGTVSGLIAGDLTLVDRLPLTLAGTVAAATADLTAPSVTQDASGALFASLLTSGGGIPGEVVLPGTANAIGTIAGLTAAGLRVVDQFPLELAGTVGLGASGTADITAQGLTQDRTGALIAGLLTSSGGIGGPVVLSGTTNAIGTIGALTAAGLTVVNSQALTLSGLVSAGPAGTADISAPGLTQGPDGTLIAGVLTSTGGLGTPAPVILTNAVLTAQGGGVSLLGQANKIGTIAGLTAAGPVIVADQAPVLTVAGSVGSSGGNVFLNNGTGQVGFAPGATLSAVAGGTVGIVADSLTNLGVAGGGQINVGTAGMLALSPATARAFVLGGPGTLALPGAVGIAAGTLRIGPATADPVIGPAARPSSVAVTAAFDAGGANLVLNTTGAVTQTAPLLNVGDLSGTAASIALTGPGNTIARIGGGTLTAAGGTLTLANAAALTVAGTVTAPAGGVSIGTGTNALTFAPGAAIVSQAGGTIGLIAGSLLNLGQPGATGTVNTGGGLFALAPGGTGATLTLGATGGLSLIDLTGISAASLRLGAAGTATAGQIAIAGTFSAGNLPLELDATGAVTQTAPLTNVPSLSIGAGAAALTNTGNRIGQIGGTAAAGTFAVQDAVNLTIAGTVQATAGDIFLGAGTNTLTFAPAASVLSLSGGRVGLQADRLVNLGGGSATVSAGVLELAPATAGTVTLGASGPLALPAMGSLNGLTTLRIGAVTLPNGTAPTVTAGSIAVAGSFAAATQGMALDLEANGGIGQAASAPLLGFGTLTASTNGAIGDIVLGQTANAIAALTNIGVAKGDFTFADSPVSGTFAVPAGLTIAANNVSMAIAGTLAVTGTISAAGGTGTLGLAARGPVADLTIGPGASIGGRAATGLTADRDIVQTGGFVNGGTVSIAAGRAVTQSGGTVTAAGAGLSVTAASLTQTGTTAALLSARTLAIAAPGGISLAGTNLAAGGATLTANGGTIAVLSGTLGSGIDLSLSGIAFAQSGGTAAAAGTLSVSVSGTANQTGGALGADTVLDSAASTNLSPAFGSTPVSAAGLGLAAARPSRIAVTTSLDYTVPAAGLAANWVDLRSPGTIAQSGPVTAILLTGTAAAASLGNPGNNVGALGRFATTNGFSFTDSAGLSVVDQVSVSAPGGVLSLRTPSLSILHTAGGSLTVPSVLGGTEVTVANAGSLTVASAGTIALRTDSLSADPGQAVNGVLVSAPDGLVAIAPDTNGLPISLGGTAGLSLTQAVLNTISTAGTASQSQQALILGSLDGATPRAGSIGIAAGIDLTSTARTLALFATGDIAESGAGALTVGTLTAVSAAGNIYLGGTNAVANLGGAAITGLIAPNGNVLFANAAGLTIPAGARIADAGTAGSFVEIDATGNLTAAGTIAGGSVFLRAGNASAAGTLTVAASGLVSAIAGGEADLAAGVAYTPATAVTGPSQVHGLGANTQGGLIAAGTITAGIATPGTAPTTAAAATGGWGPGTIGLFAAGDIVQTGMIGAGTLRGLAGGMAALTGAGTSTVNQIATLGSFTTGTGFSFRDGQALVLGGPLTAATGNLTVGVSDTRGAAVGAADIALTGLAAANAGTVALTATGNIYEAAGGATVARSLTVRAGTDPDSGLTAASGPGEIAFFGNANQVGTFAAVAPGSLLFNNGGDLAITGSVIAGTSSTAATVRALTAARGPFGTAADQPGPLLEIDTIRAGSSTSGNLTVAATAVLRSGQSGGAIGGLALRAGDATHDGGLSVAGQVSATGTALLTAAVSGATPAAAVRAPTATPATDGIAIGGTVAAGTVIAMAAGTIVEPGTLIAGLLTGLAGGSADLSGAGSPSANRIGTLGPFDSNLAFSLSPGFTLRDGQALVVGGPVIDHAAGSVSAVTLSVTASGNGAQGPVDLTLGGPVTAGTVRLEATGNVIQTPGAAIVTAGTLVAQAGFVPDTDPAGHAPGAALAGAILANGSVSLPNANQVAALGPTSAAGDLVLTDGTGLSAVGPVTVGGLLRLGVTGDLTIGKSVFVLAGGGSLTTTGGIVVAGSVSVANTLTMTAAGGMLLTGTVSAGGTIAAADGGTLTLTGDTSLTAGTAIQLTDTGAVQLGGTLTAPSIVVTNAAGTVTALPDTTIATGGTVHPMGAVSQDDLPTAATTNGFFVTAGSFSQTGTLNVTGTAPVARFDSDSKILFDSAAGLMAPNAWVILAVTGAPAGDVAIQGHLAAGNLNVVFGRGGGSAALMGSVAGLTGDAAAAAASISPTTNTHFRVNQCPIASVNCVVLTTQSAPAPPPLRDVVLGSISYPSDEADVLLPLVSDRVY